MFLLWVIKDVGSVTTTTILTVVHRSHEVVGVLRRRVERVASRLGLAGWRPEVSYEGTPDVVAAAPVHPSVIEDRVEHRAAAPGRGVRCEQLLKRRMSGKVAVVKQCGAGVLVFIPTALLS